MSSQSRFSAYTSALKALSKRTGAPLPSLILSFGILHELTAVVPLVGVFYISRTLGVGGSIVNAAISDKATSTIQERPVIKWGKEKVRKWVEEGDGWAERVGRRYGVFGYDKRRPGEVSGDGLVDAKSGRRFAGDVANAVVAYGVTKALLPVRIGASMYFAPGFSRAVLNPVRRAVVGVFRKIQP